MLQRRISIYEGGAPVQRQCPEGGCANGGKCSLDGKCACQRGFRGRRCQLAEVGYGPDGTSRESAAQDCKAIKKDYPKSGSGLYWTKGSGTTRKVWCNMVDGGGGWTVLMQWNGRTPSARHFFDSWTPGMKFKTNAAPSASGTASHTMIYPENGYAEIAIACVDSTGKVRPSTMLRQQKGWIGTKFFAGGYPSSRTQPNVFQTRGETLFWSSASDWRELNLADVSNTIPVHTNGAGYTIWRSGRSSCGQTQMGGGHIPVTPANQLVVMVR